MAAKNDYKVLICDPVDSALINGLQSAGFPVSYRPSITGTELVEAIPEYRILVVRSRTKVTSAVLDRADNLRIIARAGIGTDNIDIKAASKKGVHIVTAAGSSTQSVAELNVALMVNLARNVPRLSSMVKSGTWSKETGMELFGKTAGIIGFGRIGLATAMILRSMGMAVVAHDIVTSDERISSVDGRYVSLDELLRLSDVIFILATLSEEAGGMINGEHLNSMKKGALIINTSRSEFIDGPDLLSALKNRQIGGYAADVTWNEPPSAPWEKELIAMDNVIITPHIGAQTIEAQRRVAEYTLKNLLVKMEEIAK